LKDIRFTTRVFKEGFSFVAYAPELDLSSCGDSEEKAAQNLKEVVRLFLEECEKIGTLKRVLGEHSGTGHAETRRTQRAISRKFAKPAKKPFEP
jgi:predicted RNase H-like HicB family nuclease